MDLGGYRFRGIGVEGRARSLVDAINNLADFWDSRPSLVMHGWGVLNIRITIAGREATFEIADPVLLDQIEGNNMQGLIDLIAEDMGLDRRQTEQILSESSEVVATVDRIRPPQAPGAWTGTVDTDLQTQVVLSEAAGDWVGSLSREIDREIRRGKGRPRSLRGKAIVRMAVDLGRRKKIGDGALSRMTGIPRSTLGDTRARMDREKRVVRTFADRTPGQRLTPAQERTVLDAVTRNDNNAAETARELGLAARTVREVRARAQREERVPVRYTNEVKTKLLNLVRTEGITATAAGRRLGVADRTARGWIYKAKWK